MTIPLPAVRRVAVRRSVGAARVTLAALLLAGCTVGPDFDAPSPWWNPASWGDRTTTARETASTPVPAPIDPQWWTLFNDPTLTTLEQRLAAANLDVRVATIRLAEARAAAAIAGAPGLPSLNANGSYTRQQLSRQGALSLVPQGGAASQSNGLPSGQAAVPNPGLFSPFDLFQYGFDASWELDIWGRVRRSVESADATLQATEEQRRDTLVTAAAELARAYVQLRGVQRNIDITGQNLATARQSLALTRQRAAGGVTTDLDVANAVAQVETIAAEIPPLQSREATLMNAIALLLGEPPASLDPLLAAPNAIPPVPPRIPVGLPSELARRRPDIRRAEAQLHAATADVGVAVGDFYPRITLSGSVALQATQFSKLGNWGQANTYAFGPAITLPIFEGGRLTNQLELREAQQQEAAVTYQRTVLAALHEVANALTAFDAEQARRARLAQAVAQNRRALGLARERYTQGLTDFLQVLDVQRSLLLAEQQLTDTTTNVSTGLVQIYKVLGGGWETDFPTVPPAPQVSKAAL